MLKIKSKPLMQKVLITYRTGDVYVHVYPAFKARDFFCELVKLYLDYPDTGIYSIEVLDHLGKPYRTYIVNYNKPSRS